jgi:tripartite-type tricarboxylate transporter receptor subunit TctC
MLPLAASVPANAADWPTKPVTLVVPQGTGSGSDVVARLLATYMAPALGQPVVVDNRTGGGGIIAHQSVMRAAPDGYTILFTSTAAVAGGSGDERIGQVHAR